ncbi:MAG: hypothetical protein QNJ40_05325 [Xanthomonadales bacterium]|nr:hypothetical protein [Xanthomonadales bacterium]
MKPQLIRKTRRSAVAGLLLSLVGLSAGAGPFVYQGALLDGGTRANGNFDFRITPYAVATGGTELETSHDLPGQTVNDGLIHLLLDFDIGTLASTELWLDIQVRGEGQTEFTQLQPRQRVRQVPRAAIADVIGPNGVDSFAIAPDGVAFADVAPGAVDSARIAPGAVTAEKIRDLAVSGEKVAASAVGSVQLATGAVGMVQIGANAVGSTEIAANAVGASEIAANAVVSNRIVDSSVDTAELAVGAVGTSEIASGAVGADAIVTRAVGSSEINTSEIQRRVTGACPLGTVVRSINSNGSVICMNDLRGVVRLGAPVSQTAIFGQVTALSPVSSHICMLSRVGINDANQASEIGRCRVYVDGDRWMLESFEEGQDPEARCSAACVSIIRS